MPDREQFTFYGSFMRGISRIKNKTARCDAYDAIVTYALTGKEPDIDSMPDAAAIAFVMARPNIDASRKKAEAGRRGGSSSLPESDKQTVSKPEANSKQTASNDEANRKQVKEQVKGEEQGQDKEQMLEGVPPYPPQKAKTVFHPPTVEEVAAYCRERGNHVDAQRFVDFYASKGWLVGKSRMKDWKAAVRTWESRNDGNRVQTSTGGFLGIVEDMRGDLGDGNGDWSDSGLHRDPFPKLLSGAD